MSCGVFDAFHFHLGGDNMDQCGQREPFSSEKQHSNRTEGLVQAETS